jgi:hypothetical protein
MAKRLKWGTIEYLNTLIDEYFADPAVAPNIAGLCLKLNIHRDTWHYYTSDQWQYNRKDIEQEVKDRNAAETAENGLFEELMEISGKSVIGDGDNIEDDVIKARVSDLLKKAQLRFEDFNNTQIYAAKNPAGPIFIAKACFGYRDNDPAETVQQQLPTKIIINVLPQPAKPVMEALPTTSYSIESAK